jgi:Rad3-related DNA helicase
MVVDYFPFPSYRPGQKEAIEFILDAFNNGKKFVLLDAPTGSGKSAIAYAVAHHFAKTYYLTSTKILQMQLLNDFGHDGFMAVLKGRNAYKCNTWPKKLEEAASDKAAKTSWRESMIRQISRPEFNFNCNVGFCKLVMHTSSLGECIGVCEYWEHVRKALESRMCVMNFDSFLYQTSHSKSFRNEHRSLMVADECHNSESKLLDFVALIISDQDLDIMLEEKKNAAEYANYFKEIDLLQRVSLLLQIALSKDDIHKADRLEALRSKLNLFLNDESSGKWICNFIKRERHRVVEIKPLFVDKFARDLLFSKSDHILMMSATILSPKIVMNSLGISSEDAIYYKMPNHFPVKNRLIHLEPCGSLNHKNKMDTFPKLIQSVDDICSRHAGQKGIIHTHNFEIAELLMRECKLSGRFLYQKRFIDKDEMLKAHTNGTDTVIVAPAMHEGLDLIDDLSRFQIICKVPYPNQIDNPQLKERVKLSWDYYIWLTALKMVQCYGRSIRHDNDYATTYILDSDFSKFLDWSVDMLPDWFLEALQV